ncbi:MAG TPA: beta-ketoacyl-[acyl-carrier-protein] synthase family protein [Candidatus Brocadiia bacterium]|nr:beta-ketoacyl-[acyl-carrier-protein] synthase family protein [Candidatus Brocadiia bacterium]
MGSAQRRVAITGMGFLTPAGGDLDTFWAACCSGRSALRPFQNLDTTGLPVTVGGEVDNAFFAPQEMPDSLKTVDRALLLAQAAAGRALRSAGFDTASPDLQPIALALGTGAGPNESAESCYGTFFLKGPKALRPRTVTRYMFNSIAAEISLAFHLTGAQFTVAAACASANMAMARAVDLIRLGRETTVLTGGADMPLTTSCIAAWNAMRILATSPDPQRCCLPFHRQRTGFSLAEGAALFVFEEMEHAQRRGAAILAEVAGCGENCDAIHITRPDAARQADCIRLALKDAGVQPDQVDYINAHGTGTDANDATETEAIKMALGSHAKRVLISSTKSVIGHAMGASGALELVAVIAALQRQTAPPTANLDEADPACDLDYVPLKPRPAPLRIVLSNSFAFGGANSVLVLRRFEENN